MWSWGCMRQFWIWACPVDVFQRDRPWSRSSTTFFTCSCWFGGVVHAILWYHHVSLCVAIGWDVWKPLKLNLKLLSFFCASTVFRSVGWLMGGGILSTTTPWRVWRWSFGKCATALWHRHKSEVGKHAQSFETFCHILICPDNFTNVSLLSPHMCHFYPFFTYLILPLAKSMSAGNRPLATSQEAAFSKWSKTRHGRIVVYCKADTEIIQTIHGSASPGVWRCAGLSSWHVLFIFLRRLELQSAALFCSGAGVLCHAGDGDACSGIPSGVQCFQ